MKKGIGNFVYNFSDDQWSWIEQNMERLNISERMAARAGMFFAKSAQLDPDFWAEGWDMTYREKIKASINFLMNTEWGKGVGSYIVKMLWMMYFFGKIDVIAGSSACASIFGDYIKIGTLTLSLYPIEFVGLILAHEGAHCWEFQTIIAGSYPWVEDYDWGDGLTLSEGAAMLFSQPLFREISPSLMIHSDPLGYIDREIWVGIGWSKIVSQNPGMSVERLILLLGRYYY